MKEPNKVEGVSNPCEASGIVALLRSEIETHYATATNQHEAGGLVGDIDADMFDQDQPDHIKVRLVQAFASLLSSWMTVILGSLNYWAQPDLKYYSFCQSVAIVRT